MRGMTALGGVQVLQILVNLVRGKFVALLLGPEGMGISQLLTSSTTTLRQFASCGLPLSIVREVAATRNTDATDAAPTGLPTDVVVAIARRTVRWVALAAMVLCAAGSALLSRLTFANDLYTWSFVALSVMMLFSVLGDGEMAVLQGLHQVKRLSRASLVGATVGLVAGVPLYYFFGYGGIVPAMILLSVAMWAFYRYNSRRATSERSCGAISRKLRREVVRRMLSLGVVLMAGTVFTTLVSYLINMWVRAYGSVGDVGLFQAANTIAGQYVGVVFAAMSLDYLPRLSAAIADNRSMTEIVNRQFNVVGMLMAPLSIALILTAPLLIRVLTSEEFMEVVPLVRWMALGLFLRSMSYPMGYIAFAKGNKRLYFCLEGAFGCSVMLIVNCLCYWIWGLVGLGIAVVVVHAVDIAAYYIVNHRAYGFSVDFATLRFMALLFVLVLLAFLATLIPDHTIGYAAIALLLLVTSLLCYRAMRRRIAN